MNNNTNMTQPLFDAEPNNTAQQKPLTLVDKLAGDRQKWTQEVTELNDMMKTLPKIIVYNILLLYKISTSPPLCFHEVN